MTIQSHPIQSKPIQYNALEAAALKLSTPKDNKNGDVTKLPFANDTCALIALVVVVDVV